MQPPRLATETIALIQRVARDLWLEPFVTAGMTSEAPAVVIGGGLRGRF